MPPVLDVVSDFHLLETTFGVSDCLPGLLDLGRVKNKHISLKSCDIGVTRKAVIIPIKQAHIESI